MKDAFRNRRLLSGRGGSIALLLSGTAAFLLTVSGCRNSTGPTPEDPTDQEVAISASDLSETVITMMEEAIQDEYHAEMTYRKVIATFGSVRPFSNIVNAEVRHSSALAVLFTRYGLDLPESKWNMENVPSFESVTEACRVAAEAEIANVALYDEYLSSSLPDDIRFVFENNRRASLQNHLPAFQRCGG